MKGKEIWLMNLFVTIAKAMEQGADVFRREAAEVIMLAKMKKLLLQR